MMDGLPLITWRRPGLIGLHTPNWATAAAKGGRTHRLPPMLLGWVARRPPTTPMARAPGRRAALGRRRGVLATQMLPTGLHGGVRRLRPPTRLEGCVGRQRQVLHARTAHSLPAAPRGPPLCWLWPLYASPVAPLWGRGPPLVLRPFGSGLPLPVPHPGGPPVHCHWRDTALAGFRADRGDSVAHYGLVLYAVASASSLPPLLLHPNIRLRPPCPHPSGAIVAPASAPCYRTFPTKACAMWWR